MSRPLNEILKFPRNTRKVVQRRNPNENGELPRLTYTICFEIRDWAGSHAGAVSLFCAETSC